MIPEPKETPLTIFPLEHERKRSAARAQPTELAGCLKLAPENRDRLRMIAVKNPTMKARIDYLTAAARRPLGERLRAIIAGAVSLGWRVEKDYFLSYHKEEPAASGRLAPGGPEYTVKRVIRKNRFVYEIYVGESMRAPDRVIKSEQKVHKLGYPDDAVALLRELIKKLPRTRATDVYKQVGDSIIQRVSVFRERFWRRSYYAVIFSTYYKGSSRDSRRFFEKGYVPIDTLLPPDGQSPRHIIIDAGPNPEFIPRPTRGGSAAGTRFVIIPGEINFKAHGDTLLPYAASSIASTQFLAAHPRFERITRHSGIADELIKAETLFVSERILLSPRTIADAYRAVLRAYRTLRMTAAGTLLFSFFYGTLEGAIVNPMMAMIEHHYLVLGWVTVTALYFYPVIESLIEIKSGIKFDEVRNAEKSRRLPRVYINEELRAVQLRVALFYAAAAGVLMLLYPPVFLRLIGGLPFAVPALFALFFCNKLFKDWAEYFEINNTFRIFIRTVGRDPVHHRNLLKVRSFEEGLRMLLRVTGLGCGMALMWANPTVAIAVAGAGALIGCASKFVFPLFGTEYAVSVSTDTRPFPLDNHNYALIPERVRLRAKRDPRFEARGPRWVSLDPQDIEILVDGGDPDDVPSVRAYPGNTFSSLNKKWKLTWRHRCTIVIELHGSTPLELILHQSGQQIRYTLMRAQPSVEPNRGTP